MSGQFTLWVPEYVSGGNQVAELVKHWPADLAVASLSPAAGRDLFNLKWDAIAHSLSLQPTYYPDMTEVLLKRM